MMKAEEKTKSIESDRHNSKLFDGSRYPKTYQPAIHNKMFGWLAIIFFTYLLFQILIFFKNNNTHYELIAIALITFAWLYIEVIKVRLGYKVQLYADRVELNSLFGKKTMRRSDIKTCEYWGGGLAMVKINQTKYGGFFVRTLGEFEKDDDFSAWFNTLDAEIIEPVPNKLAA